MCKMVIGFGRGFFLAFLSSSLLLACIKSLSPPLAPKSTKTTKAPSSVSEMIHAAHQYLRENKTNGAYECLTTAYAQNSQAPGLMAAFEAFFRTRIRLAGGKQDAPDRMGLASLLNDQHRFEESARELRLVLKESSSSSSSSGLSSAMREQAQVRLFRALAAICNWDNFTQDSLSLLQSVRQCLDENENSADEEHFRVPALHPFEALKWPCISLQDATNVASLYAKRAMQNVKTNVDANNMDDKIQQPVQKFEAAQNQSIQRISQNQIHPSKRSIKLAYISPDFSGTHPLAFLMQDVFRFHNQSQFELYLYSLEGNDDDSSPEVNKIRDAGSWKVFPAGASPHDIAATIRQKDQPDILVDLCGYAGTSVCSEVMAHRVAPIQVSYMGFPGSSGAPYLDYMIVDPVVVPPRAYSQPIQANNLRQHYTEKLLYMPHCYFVNSHRHAVNITDIENLVRDKYGLPEDGFVFCCHNRPDKIDPSTCRLWFRALKLIRETYKINAVLWLLTSGDQMEANLRKIAEKEFQLADDCLVFAEVAPREEHLQRLSLADLFLDTPVYNAHTVGCDVLFAGVPMLSLLRPSSTSANEEDLQPENGEFFVPTEKLASRVGASLLTAVDLEEMVVPDMQAYEDRMVKCATDPDWFHSQIAMKLVKNKRSSPLFDTERWVRNLEVGLTFISQAQDQKGDIAIVEDA